MGGNGHYAGNVANTLNASDRPEFTGAGYKVVAQWRDINNKPIAPHLFNGGGQMQTVNAPVIPVGALLDSWNSGAGAYGGANIGPAPSLVYPSTMPSLTVPNGLPETHGGNPNFIHCLNDFYVEAGAHIVVQPGSRLTLWVEDDIDIGFNAQINMSGLQPSRCLIYHPHAEVILFNQSGDLCGHVVSPLGLMHLKQNDHFYGTFTGKDLVLDANSGMHWDGIPTTVCGSNLADTAGAAGVLSTAAISSASSFEQWYSDVLGVNLSAKHTIELVKDPSGIYECLDDEFFPVDNILFGNQGQAHNYFFTYALRTTFVHEACHAEPRFFEFQGADDAWLFINGELAMDLGGVIPNTLQHVQLDRLGLSDGQTCTFEFFFAQRQTALSIFRMRTNVPLESVTSYDTVSASVD
jgi:fibro-slime domain-containing protein